MTNLGPQNAFTCPPNSANTTPSYFPVGAEGACSTTNCNGALPEGSTMRYFRFLFFYRILLNCLILETCKLFLLPNHILTLADDHFTANVWSVIVFVFFNTLGLSIYLSIPTTVLLQKQIGQTTLLLKPVRHHQSSVILHLHEANKTFSHTFLLFFFSLVKSPDGLGSGYAGRSAAMVVITSILCAAAALLLLLLLIALILAW